MKVNRFVYWTPRILGILFVLFLALFSLDVFDSCSGFFDCALGLLIHSIPALILLVLLIISWKYEIVGAIAFVLAGLAYIMLVILSNNLEFIVLERMAIISLPAFIIGYLFYLNWKKR